MNPVKLVGESLRAAGSAIQFLPEEHAPERRKLRAEIRGVCERCEDAYATVLERLRPLKESYGDRRALADMLRRFAADRETRAAFNPLALCEDVDQILQTLERDLDRLKYSVDFWRIYRLETAIASAEDYERQLRDYYEDYARAMEELAAQLQWAAPDEEPLERQAYARHIVDSFEADLRDTLRDIQAAKEIVREPV